MEENNINDILGIESSKKQSNHEALNTDRTNNSKSKNENERFAHILDIIGIILYIIGIIAAIYLFDKFSTSGWSGKFDEDKVPIALMISTIILFYHVVFGLICQGLSRLLANMKK
jgi:hypothetical protein